MSKTNSWNVAHERKLRQEAERVAIRHSFARAAISGKVAVVASDAGGEYYLEDMEAASEDIAVRAYMLADAMMEARMEKPDADEQTPKID